MSAPCDLCGMPTPCIAKLGAERVWRNHDLDDDARFACDCSTCIALRGPADRANLHLDQMDAEAAPAPEPKP